MKVAACKYPIGEPRDFAAFAARQAALLGEAKARGAQLAVLPEYLSLELAAMFDDAIRGDLHASLAAIQPLRDDWLSLYAGLARELGIGIVAGSFLLDMGRGRYRNRSDFFAADGGHLWQDKLRLTGFEKRTGVIDSGDALKVFDAGGVRAGIAVCYDSEFPLPVRAQCEAGARLLLVPSCTDTDAGATRVRVGCLARALENRCFVAQAVTAGEAPWSPALDTNTGEAALIAPMDVGLPSDGMLVQTRGSEAWAIAELDFDALEASRAQAQVANDRDWSAQYFPTVLRARLERAGDHETAAMLARA
ncbi:MAG TPA: carbon-nitrogen hydrolase family protein [Thermomonas sp.]|jgi:predicted amidohydrolase|uniref:carbon-nitrogen hydrolase family protein n=1 Tax=Thermomonas sp. TaxID=1971895 RepID=UPI002CB9F20B|nr:carbon-nitrogen hydrolase family protein [Thermomonas sp.]HPW12041.1 carbon-nitrogen hydrolase family protein [Thermomonas sp.]